MIAAGILMILVAVSMYSPSLLGMHVGLRIDQDAVKAFAIKVNLSEIDEGIDPRDILVTVLNGGREVEVPYTIRPSGTYSLYYSYDVVYNNVSIRKLTYHDYINVAYKIITGRIKDSSVKYKESKLEYYTRSHYERLILVYIPAWIHPSHDYRDHTGWYWAAVESRLTKRAVLTYEKYTLYVYYGGKSYGQVYRLLDIPDEVPNTTLYLKTINIKQGSENPGSYYVDLKTNAMEQVKDEAELVRREEYRGPMSSEQYYVMWYARPWKSQSAGAGRIQLGNVLNKTLTGSSTYSISDSFYIGYNTTRYELWIWLSTDKPNYGYLSVTLNDGAPIGWEFDIDPGELAGFGIIVYTGSDEPGNYLDPGEVSVDISLSVIDSTARLVLISTATAKALVSSTSYHNGIYKAERMLQGFGKILDNDLYQNPLDERYDVIYSGEAGLASALPRNFVIASYYPYLRIDVESSPDQKYDRVIQLYIDDTLFAEKTAKNPNLPNGTEGVRSTYFFISGQDLTDKIIDDMRRGSSPVIRVVIKGFQPPDDSYMAREEWFITGKLVYYARASCIRQQSGNDQILHFEDPTITYTGASGSIYHFVSFEPYGAIDDLQLTNGFTDVVERVVDIYAHPASQGSVDPALVTLFFNPTARLAGDGYISGYAHVRKIEFTLEYEAPYGTNIHVYQATGYGPGTSKTREELEAIQWGLWAAGMSLSIVSFGYGNYIISAGSILATALSAPGLYVYGSQLSATKYEYENTVRVETVWDPGWDNTQPVAPLEIRMTIIPDSSWPAGEPSYIFYDYDMYMIFWKNYFGPLPRQEGYTSNYGYAVVYSREG